MIESRNKREGWYAGKSYSNCWKRQWPYVWDKRKCRTRSDYKKLFKPKHILLTLSCTEFGRIENFRFISAEIIQDTNPIR